MRLAIETSTPLGAIAVGDGETLVAESILSVRATHSETVLDEAARLLDRAGLRPRDLEAVVVGSGPGSFTGVRIAASLAKGLCFAHDLPLFAYSSLWALAASVSVARICAVFDARRGEVYAATFPDGAAVPPDRGPLVTTIDELLGSLDPAASWVFAGEGARVHASRIERAGGRIVPVHAAVPRASALLWLSRVAGELGRVRERGLWEPEYVRASGAERGIGG